MTDAPGNGSPSKPMMFPVIDCSTWDELARRLDECEFWIFRGQASADWGLSSSLERCVPPNESRHQMEVDLFGGFQRRAHNHLESARLPRTAGEWLALMQHYGAPTRLVDFTSSPFVAAYFAFEEAGAVNAEACAIWAISAAWVRFNMCLLAERQQGMFGRTYEAIRQAAQPGRNPAEPATEADRYKIGLYIGSFVETAAMTKQSPMVSVFQPYRLSERMDAQQGVFLWPGTVDVDVMENLRAFEDFYRGVRIFVTPTRERGRALDQLRKMNITRSSLFPGFEGFAQSFRYLPIRESDESRRRRLGEDAE